MQEGTPPRHAADDDGVLPQNLLHEAAPPRSGQTESWPPPPFLACLTGDFWVEHVKISPGGGAEVPGHCVEDTNEQILGNQPWADFLNFEMKVRRGGPFGESTMTAPKYANRARPKPTES